MPKLFELVRFGPDELDPQAVGMDSPIEDQVRVVFEAARRHAQLNGFEPFSYGGRNGLKGQMVMSRLVRDIFTTHTTNADDIKILGSIISQALKRTKAAVCIHRPTNNMDTTPTWFVANEMPVDLVPVVLNIRNKSAGSKGSQTFSEDKFLNYTERRISAEEAGETQPPGEVTVTTTTAEQNVQPPISAALKATQERSRKFRERVLEEITTNPVPLTARDVTTLLAADGFDYAVSTVRDVLLELRQEGKIVGRQETRDEARLRTHNGRMPKSHRPMLFVAAPGPVTTRTALPAGILPDTLPASAVRKARRDQKEAQEKTVVATAGFEEPTTISSAPADSAKDRLEQWATLGRSALDTLLEAALAGAGDPADKARITELEAALGEAQAKVEKLTGQNEALRAAINSLT